MKNKKNLRLGKNLEQKNIAEKLKNQRLKEKKKTSLKMTFAKLFDILFRQIDVRFIIDLEINCFSIT